MNLQEAAAIIQAELKLPFVHVKADGGICDSICITVSEQPKSEWEFGILQNSPWAKYMIFCQKNGRDCQYEKDATGYTLSGSEYNHTSKTLRNIKKETTLENIVQKVIKALNA